MSKRSGLIGGISGAIGGSFGMFLGSNLVDIIVLNNLVQEYIVIAITAGLVSYIVSTVLDRLWK
ncbi:hypothetical protein JCM14036_22340 [Desulfotomaculum defluvii]